MLYLTSLSLSSDCPL